MKKLFILILLLLGNSVNENAMALVQVPIKLELTDSQFASYGFRIELQTKSDLRCQTHQSLIIIEVPKKHLYFEHLRTRLRKSPLPGNLVDVKPTLISNIQGTDDKFRQLSICMEKREFLDSYIVYEFRTPTESDPTKPSKELWLILLNDTLKQVTEIK